MKSKNDSSPYAAQVSQWRRLWAILLSPRPPRDEKPSSAEKVKATKDSDRHPPQIKD